MQPCRRVAGEPGEEVVVRIKAGANRVTPVLPIEHGQVLPDEVVSLFIGASGSLRILIRQMVGDDRGVDVPVQGRCLPAEASHVRGEDMRRRRIVLEGHAHATAARHYLQ